jgi:hypothetical protein
MLAEMEKRLTLASMVVVMAKPPGRPEKVLEMDLDKSWHAPAQRVAPAFAGTDWRLWTELRVSITQQGPRTSVLALCNKIKYVC